MHDYSTTSQLREEVPPNAEGIAMLLTTALKILNVEQSKSRARYCIQAARQLALAFAEAAPKCPPGTIDSRAATCTRRHVCTQIGCENGKGCLGYLFTQEESRAEPSK